MSSKNPNETKEKTFENVIFFRVYLDSVSDQAKTTNVYRNGRQQCRIRVGYIAVDANENQVLVDDSQVRLIFYTGGVKIWHGNDWSNGATWYSSFTDRGYTWTPNDMAEAKALQDDIDKVLSENIDIRSLTMFRPGEKRRIQSLTSQAPEHSWDPAFFEAMVEETRIHAAADQTTHEDNESRLVAGCVNGVSPDANDKPIIIERHGRQYGAQTKIFYLSSLNELPEDIAAELASAGNNKRFMTNHINVDDDDGTGNGRGQFNSKVNVNPVTPPSYPIDYFGDFLERRDDHYVLLDTYVWWGGSHQMRATEQYIHLKVAGVYKKLLRIVSPDMTMVCLYWDAGDVGAEWSYSYAGQPGSSTLWHEVQTIGYFTANSSRIFNSNDLIGLMGGRIVRDQDGKVTIGQIMSNQHLQINDWNGLHRSKNSVNLVVEDEFGNFHNLRLYLPTGDYSFNYVALQKR